MAEASQPTTDRFNLERFVAAQALVFDAALGGLKAGRKRSHWMWFMFPQLRGLGASPTAQFYGIDSLEKARAYLSHPVLGLRIVTCTEAVLATKGRSLHDIFSYPKRDEVPVVDDPPRENSGQTHIEEYLIGVCPGFPT